MSDIAIAVHNLGKKYLIGEEQQGYQTLRDTIAGAWGGKRKRKDREESPERMIWALKDLSFEIKRGEVVGVIGRNGAGKSTLLKILSRITEPSSGYADIYGQVGTLLEVGTGFHPELTGRENVYLNGAILGMQKSEILKNFDAIVSFAEVERFLDTPVKHYSTGMYLRLAFAVAAHLNPDILLVDEVLAVGDLGFQKKCLGKMDDVAKQGRTILFVSHNMGAVRSLCEKGIVLNEGRVYSVGDISSSVEDYYKLSTIEKNAVATPPASGFAFGPVCLDNQDGSTIEQSEPCEFSVTLHFGTEVAGFTLLSILDDMHQRRVFHLRSDSTDLDARVWKGSYRFRLRLPAMWLEPGLYSFYFKIMPWGGDGRHKILSDIFHLDVGGNSCGFNSILSPKRDISVEEVQPTTSLSVLEYAQ
jgi:lipopolysaccharide transport system ATP-binding protein